VSTAVQQKSSAAYVNVNVSRMRDARTRHATREVALCVVWSHWTVYLRAAGQYGQMLTDALSGASAVARLAVF